MNHEILSLADKITLLSELEHLRRHCIRSAHVTEEDDKKFYYQVKAKQLQDLRRKVQDKWLKTDELDWCIVKSSATLKQLNNEILMEDLELFSDIERVADDLLGTALGEDLSGCKSCLEDSAPLKTSKGHATTAMGIIIEDAIANPTEAHQPTGHKMGSRIQ